MIYLTDAREVFGDDGVGCLTILLNGIREFFKEIPPDQMSTTFVFIYPMRDFGVEETREGMERIATALSRESLSGHSKRMAEAPAIVIHVRTDGRYDVVASTDMPPLETLSQSSLVFVNQDGMDRFFIGNRTSTMPILATGARSNFAVATVRDLEEALEKYRQVAADVRCPILEHIWIGCRSGHRLVLRNKPEATMRRSLEWFLSTRIRGDVSVRSEHNTDESKPVDLVVNWFGSKMRALIEIKWLGDSLSSGSSGTRFTTYRDRRAQQGADQLIDYLDREQSTEPNTSLKGYLVVFDGRRRGVIDSGTPLTSMDALFYRGREISLSRDYAAERTEIAPLIRYFLEPRSSQFAPPGETDRV